MNQFTVYSNWSLFTKGVDQFHHGKNVQIHSKSSEIYNELGRILV
jgi:hypothetical protein